jgi:hypothetical protein
MKVALDRADGNPPCRLDVCLGQIRLQVFQTSLHGTCRDQHLRNEEIAGFEALTNLVHSRDQGIVQNIFRADSSRKRCLDASFDFKRMAINHVLVNIF